MAYSYVTYLGTGSLTYFTVPFSYVDKANIVVTVDTNPVSFTWLNDSTVNISPAPALDTKIQISRNTKKDALLVDYNDGSVLTERDLDTANKQIFFIAQETLDNTALSLSDFNAFVTDAGEYARQAYEYERLSYDHMQNAEDAADNAEIFKDTAGVYANQALTAAINVEAQVNSATTAVTDAATSAIAAVTSASTSATTAAAAAASSATNAAASATTASTSASASASSAAAAAASAGTASKYIGPSSSNPTVRTDGSALQAGDLYFNTVVVEMRVYSGSTWQPQAASPDTLTERSFVATAGQTSYTFTGSYRVGYTFVYVNGVLLDATDTTMTDGTTVTFAVALAAGDEVRILSFKAVGTVVVSDIIGLQTSLDSKVSTSSLATVATSGSYTDLTSKPTIPTSVSQLTNDSAFITSSALSSYLTSSTAATTYAPVTTTVTLAGTQSLTNKTLTSPAITTPTGIVKGDVGLGNVDNTSDATKNAATATLTNKTLGGFTETVYAVVDAAGVAISPTNGSIQTWTLGASRTPTAGTWAAGQSMTLMINDSASAFTVTWSTLGVTWVGGTAPSLAPASGYTVVTLWKVGSTIYGALTGQVA